jgi:hypothetical protein
LAAPSCVHKIFLMISRAFFLLLMVFGLSGQTARADAAPILPGSYLTIDEAVAKSDLVFEAKLTSAGTLDNEAAGKNIGPIYTGAQATGAAFYKGHAGEPIHLTIFLNNGQHETVPLVGQNYLFFAQGPPINGEYRVMKMLAATMENRRATLRAVMTEQMQQKQPENPQPAQ